MTNTLENKSRFFAQYFGQEVRIWYHLPHNKCKVSHSSLSPESVKESYLSLTPLSQISDEDCKKVFFGKTRKEMVYYLTGEYFFKEGVEEYFTQQLMHEEVDYLRSRGYALPWMGLSVETLVEWGWVKLKGGENV